MPLLKYKLFKLQLSQLHFTICVFLLTSSIVLMILLSVNMTSLSFSSMTSAKVIALTMGICSCSNKKRKIE